MFTNKEVHCDHCGCPKDIWEPLETYKNDKSCEILSEIMGFALDLEYDNGSASLLRLVKICETLRGKFPDIPDFNATVKECIDFIVDEELCATVA